MIATASASEGAASARVRCQELHPPRLLAWVSYFQIRKYRQVQRRRFHRPFLRRPSPANTSAVAIALAPAEPFATRGNRGIFDGGSVEGLVKPSAFLDAVSAPGAARAHRRRAVFRVGYGRCAGYGLVGMVLLRQLLSVPLRI